MNYHSATYHKASIYHNKVDALVIFIITQIRKRSLTIFELRNNRTLTPSVGDTGHSMMHSSNQAWILVRGASH